MRFNKYLSTFNRASAEDPLKTAFFRIEIDGFTRLGFAEGTSPKVSIEKIEYREGGDNLFVKKSPGLSKVEDIELKRGVVIAGPGAGDDDALIWLNQVIDLAAGKQGAPVFRRNIDYVLMSRNLVEVQRWRLYDAWPSGIVPFGDLKALESADSMQALTICFERLKRV